MVNALDISHDTLITKLSEELKKVKEMEPPSWTEYVKTSVSRMRAPTQKDWWYVRSASLLRTVYLQGPIGVSKLRTKYSGRKNRGVKPDKTFKGSGNIIRKSLQGLEKAGFIEKKKIDTMKKDFRKGRIVSSKGKSIIDKIVVAELKKTRTKEKKTNTEKPGTSDKK